MSDDTPKQVKFDAASFKSVTSSVGQFAEPTPEAAAEAAMWLCDGCEVCGVRWVYRKPGPSPKESHDCPGGSWAYSFIPGTPNLIWLDGRTPPGHHQFCNCPDPAGMPPDYRHIDEPSDADAHEMMGVLDLHRSGEEPVLFWPERTSREPIYAEHVGYRSVRTGWTFVVFYDGGEWDYVDRMVSPDGREIDVCPFSYFGRFKPRKAWVK